jgi:MFS family permease
LRSISTIWNCYDIKIRKRNRLPKQPFDPFRSSIDEGARQGREMLTRFSLYGFLKNQQYYEPFILLALLEKGLSFTAIGLLVGLREVVKLLLEIPSGAAADLYGHRRAMIFSFLAYIASFLLFAVAERAPLLAAAMILFGCGEAFRTGTHKAMIFEWLRREGRLAERTRVYGYTRSWSKIGSAVSALIAAAFVIASDSYASVFWLCAVPYSIGIVNFLGYPAYLDGGRAKRRPALGDAHRLALRGVREAASRGGLRRLFVESMLLEGLFKVAKDYLQPLLEGLAIALPLALVVPWGDAPLTPVGRSSLLIGVVFALLYLLMSLASRQAHRLVDIRGDEASAIRTLWWSNLAAFLLLGVALWLELPTLAVVSFVGIAVVQNLFRPTQIARFDRESSPEMGATVLSVESQAKALAAAVLAPVVGLLVDLTAAARPGSIVAFWPLAALGVLAALLALFLGKRRSDR